MFFIICSIGLSTILFLFFLILGFTLESLLSKKPPALNREFWAIPFDVSLGITFSLVVYSVLLSIVQNPSGAASITVVLLFLVILFGYFRRRLSEFSSIFTKVNLRIYFLAYLMPLVVNFFAANSISKNQMRTSGNNDPYDLLNLIKVFESPTRSYINGDSSRGLASDWVSPWLTRLISFVTHFTNFDPWTGLTFVCFFILGLLNLSIISFVIGGYIHKSNYLLKGFIASSILFSATLSYITHQGFWPQITGCIFLIQILGTFDFIPQRLKSASLPEYTFLQIASRSIFLSAVLFLVYPTFLPICIVLLLTRLVLIRKSLVAVSIGSISKAGVVKTIIILSGLVFYSLAYLRETISGTWSFLFEQGLGVYGWSRNPNDYILNSINYLGIPDWILLYVIFLITIFIVVDREAIQKSSFVNLPTISLVPIYIYIGSSTEFSSYQSWKFSSYFFFILILFVLHTMLRIY